MSRFFSTSAYFLFFRHQRTFLFFRHQRTFRAATFGLQLPGCDFRLHLPGCSFQAATSGLHLPGCSFQAATEWQQRQYLFTGRQQGFFPQQHEHKVRYSISLFGNYTIGKNPVWGYINKDTLKNESCSVIALFFEYLQERMAVY